MRGRGAGSIGDQPLGHRRAQQPDGEHSRQQGKRGLRHADCNQCERQGQHLHRHQPTAIHPVTQRYQKQQRQRASQLCGGDNPADRRVTDTEIPGQGVEERLGVIDICHAQAAGDGEEPCQAG